MIVVNLFAGAGAGKSSIAAYVFSQLKKRHISCELVTEFAKDLVWDSNIDALRCQEYVFGVQAYRQYRCRNKVDVLITDSPLPLNCVYGNFYGTATSNFNKAVMEAFDKYDNLNFFVHRAAAYDTKGRVENFTDATKIDNMIMDFMINADIPYTDVIGTEDGGEAILDKIYHALDVAYGVE